MRNGSGTWRTLYSGERTLPDWGRPSVINAALARYTFAMPLCAGRTVLDIGCGAGLGLRVLAPVASRLVGVDYSPDTLVSFKNDSPAVTRIAADALGLPFREKSFEAVTAFEIIEHLDDPRICLAEAARILTDEGVLVLSTPNRSVYSPRGTWLDYHVREYDVTELSGLLAPLFSRVALLGQAHLSHDARLDMHPLNRVLYPLKKRIDPRGIVLNRLRAAYVYCRWGERRDTCSIRQFPVTAEHIESMPVLVAVCRR